MVPPLARQRPSHDFLYRLPVHAPHHRQWRIHLGLPEQWFWGVLTSWIVAVSPAWIDEAVRGLRLESLSLLLLAFSVSGSGRGDGLVLYCLGR